MMEGFTFQADKALLDTVFDGVIVIDLKHLRISLANKAAADILGFDDPEELAGVDPLNHVSPEDRERAITTLAGLASGSCLQSGAEIKVLDKKGKDVWILARGVRLASNGNSVLLASFRDITAQKLAEIALREAEERQIQLLNSSSELILVSQEWRIVFANHSLQEAMGLSAEALARMSILDLTHPDDRKAVKRRYQQMLDGKYRPSDRAFKGIGKDGKTSWGMMRHVPFTWQGKPALMTIVQDITRQKLAEEALQESERRYRLITENITDVVWALDMNLNTTYVSPSVVHQKGYTVEEAMKLPLEEQMTPETLARIKSAIAEELVLEETGKADPHRSRTAEGETYRKDGSKLWVEITASFLRDQDGKPIGIMGITRDITERKKAQEALLRIGKAMESSSDAIGMSDAEGRHFYHNKAFSDLFEYTVEELEAAGGGPAAYVDQDVARKVFNTTMSGGSWNGEVEMVSKSGRRLPVLLRADAIKDDSGRVVGLVGVHSDITELKRAQEALTASELNYRNLFGHTLMGLEVVDAETMKVVLANDSMAKMFGFDSPEDMVGTEPLAYVLPEDLDSVIAELSRFLDDPPMRAEISARCMTKDNRIIWVNAMANRFEYVFRPSILLAMVDVTAAKEADLKTAESEEKNRLLVDNAAEAIIVVQDGALKFVNPKATEISGYSTEELLSRSFLELVYPEDRQMIADNYAKRLAGEEAPNNYWFRIVDKAGGMKWLQINTVQLSWEGRPAVLSMLNDVTERRQAEEAFRESESRYRLLVENVSDVIWSVNMRSKRVLFSPSVTRLIGYTLQEAQGMKMKEVVSPTSYPKAMMAFSELLGKQGNGSDGRSSSTQIEIELMRKDSSFVWVDISVTLLRDAKGKPAELFGVIRDVTQRRKVEEDLRTSEEYFRALIENAWDAIAIVNAEGT
ncbi:MAG: PAS domain S-box protein, partial [Dehalococcoidia bacterium]|nr:PAS domain S-box protein [Dehalococcoidia bacterium]